MSRCKMKIKKITYPTPLNEVADILNDNIDVFVETQDGMHFTMTVCTPLFYLSYMEKEGLDYVPASPPDIIVKELTHDKILKALENFCDDEGYWMKAYFLLGTTDEFCSREDMDKMIYALNKNAQEY